MRAVARGCVQQGALLASLRSRKPAGDKRLDPNGAFGDQGAAVAPSDRRGRDFEHDPEKWIPFFREDHALLKTSEGVPKYAAERIASTRAPFPANPRTDARARPRAAGDRHAAHRSARPGIRQARQARARRHQDHLQNHAAGYHLHRDRHRRLGSGVGQHAVARRPRAHGRDRPVRDAVEGHGGTAGVEARVHQDRLARRRRSEDHRRPSAQGQGARDQGGLRAAQRDRDRLHVADRRDPQSHRCGRPSGAVARRHDLVARLDRLSSRRMGRRRHRRRRAERSDDAAGNVVQRGQRESAARGEDGEAAALVSSSGTTC